MKKRNRNLWALMGVATLAGSSVAHATLLPPLTTVFPNAQVSPLSGANLIGSTSFRSFNVSQNGSTYVGGAQEWLVNGYSGNPYGSSGLTFVIQVTLTSGTNSQGGDSVIQLVSDSNFLNSPFVDVGYNTSGAQITPRTADRAAFGDTIGYAVEFRFLTSTNPSTTQITVGQSSALLIINTNATDFVR